MGYGITWQNFFLLGKVKKLLVEKVKFNLSSEKWVEAWEYTKGGKGSKRKKLFLEDGSFTPKVEGHCFL